MTWNWAALIAALLAGATALYIRHRWRRAPQAYTAMVAVAVCCFVAGAVLGAWVLHLFEPSPPPAAQPPSAQPSITPLATPLSSPSPSPSPLALPSLPSLGGSPGGYYCGTERWAVKTLSDEDAARVDLKPVSSTVALLAALPRPPTITEDRRTAPVELTTYQIRAVLLEIRDENDHDVHLVVADPSDRHKTMIAEIVDPGCSGAITSPDVADLRQARESFERLDTAQIGKGPFLKVGDLVEITGVGFFDFEHGQSGVAPNAIELHPVLGVRRVN